MSEDLSAPHITPRYPRDEVIVEPTAKWVRAFSGGRPVASSRDALLLLGWHLTPAYLFPEDDVATDALTSSGESEDPMLGTLRHYDLHGADPVVERAAWSVVDPAASAPDLTNCYGLDWDAMDAWYEESEQVFVHPRDPYHRIDVLESSRHVEIVVEDRVVASTERPRVLFETGLPPRYYLPRLDVRTDVLVPSETTTACPYKGQATHFHVSIDDNQVEDVAWSYPFPLPEVADLQNRICFYDERVDRVAVDGIAQSRPETPFS